MKKQKFMKLSAFTSDPDLGNSFTAPVSHNGEISVVFRGKDISIHGWDGSAWTMIYTWNSVDKQFTFDNTYQNYFLKSLTGYQESIGVSFFSTSRYAGSTPSLAGINRDVKLYDIDEVPIYTASDEGKFLTIRTDGSLAWLLANESFTVESEGGEEGGGAPAGPQANFLEDLERFNIPSGIYVDNGSGQGHKITFNLDGDNIVSYGGDGQAVEEEFTISWWMNLNTTQDAGTVNVLGNGTLPNRFILTVGGDLTSNAHITTRIQQDYMFNNNTGLAVAGDWVHGAYTCKSNGSNLIVRLYINGTKLPGTRSYPLGTKLLPSLASDEFAFGGNGMSGKSAKGQFDSMQIEEGVALTDEQVAAIAAQTDRQMGIGQAALIGQSAPVTYPEVQDIIESASGWNTYYGASITAEDTVLIGNHHSSMLRTTNQSLDNSIVVDTTVTMWVKTPTYNGTKQLMKWGPWSGNNSKGVQINLGTRTDAAGTAGGNALMANWTDGHIEIKVANDVHNQSAAKGYKIFFRSPVNVTDGQWHQIVVQFSNIGAGLGAGFAKVYVDGVKIDESFANHGLIQQQVDGLQTLRHNPEACKSNGWITIGQGFAGAELDEITIEEQLLTEEQIVAKYNAGR